MKILILFLVLFALVENLFAIDVSSCSSLAKGYYDYSGDTDCTKYVYCYPYGGVMVGSLYTCQGSTFYNPTLKYCQAGYACTKTTTTSTTTTTTTTTPTTSTTTPTTTTTTTTESTTTITTTQAPIFNVAAYCLNRAKGYYFYEPDPADCVKYIYCYPYDNVMRGSVYNCQGLTCFDKVLLYCKENCKC